MIATKFAQDIDPVERKPRGRMLRPEGLAGAVDGSLRRLRLDVIPPHVVLALRHRLERFSEGGPDGLVKRAVPFPLPTSVLTFGDQLSRQSV